MTFCIASLLLGGKKGGISLLVLCVSSLCSPGSLAVSESHPSIFFPRYCFASQKPSQANRTQHQPGIFQPKKMKRTPLKTNPDSLLLARANAVITHPSFHKQSHPIPSHPILPNLNYYPLTLTPSNHLKSSHLLLLPYKASLDEGSSVGTNPLALCTTTTTGCLGLEVLLDSFDDDAEEEEDGGFRSPR